MIYSSSILLNVRCFNFKSGYSPFVAHVLAQFLIGKWVNATNLHQIVRSRWARRIVQVAVFISLTCFAYFLSVLFILSSFLFFFPLLLLEVLISHLDSRPLQCPNVPTKSLAGSSEIPELDPHLVSICRCWLTLGLPPQNSSFSIYINC